MFIESTVFGGFGTLDEVLISFAILSIIIPLFYESNFNRFEISFLELLIFANLVAVL